MTTIQHYNLPNEIHTVMKSIESYHFPCENCGHDNGLFKVNLKDGWMGIICSRCNHIIKENKPNKKEYSESNWLSCKKCNHKSNLFYITYFSIKDSIDFFCPECELTMKIKLNYKEVDKK